MIVPYQLNVLLSLSDAVIITDHKHIILAVNASYERITGYSQDDIIKKKASILKTKHTPKETYNEMKLALQQGNAWSGIFTNRKKNQQLWHSSITITPFVIDGKTYYVGVFRALEELSRGSYLNEDRIQQLQGSMLKVLAISCEIRDPGIEQHLLRVQGLTKLLLERYVVRKNLKDFDMHARKIINASILHDIGKSAIPEGILYKPGALAPYERTIVEMHTQIGVDILAKIYSELEEELLEDEFILARNIILYHHEKYDGTGYPAQLSGENIPFEARVVSIVDVYDALTSKRPYKEKWSQQKAILFLIEQKGKHFDPELVDTFIELYEEGNLDLYI